MTAFERQIGDELREEIGPVPRFDAMEIVGSVATTSPRWGFQSMFGATRFVVAGVIVAVFGGFVVAGFLTQESANPPPVGASASPEASPLHRVRLPAELPDGVRSGTLDTPFGPARWASLPASPGRADSPGRMEPLPAPEGFIVLDTPNEQPQMLWRSPDLITWTPEPLTMIAADAELVLAGDTYWLIAEGPAGLWSSQDTLTWQPIDLSELVSPLPEWPGAGFALDGPISSAGVTIVPFGFKSDGSAAYLGLPDLSGDWWLESAEPGVYEAVEHGGRSGGSRLHTRLRFEETETALRVIDADDGTELAVLDGGRLAYLSERWGENGQASLGFSLGLAIVEGDALVPVDGPGSPDQKVEAFGTESGFFTYGRTPDSDLIQVWRSDDGVTWSQSQPLGDDPGEPTGVRWVAADAHSVELLAADGDGRGWTSSDGVTWREFSELTREFGESEEGLRMASGWLKLTKDELSIKRDGDDGWATTDVSELELEFDDGADSGFWDGTDWIVDTQIYIYAISPDTIVVPNEATDEDEDTRFEVWIITFDDLPS